MVLGFLSLFVSHHFSREDVPDQQAAPLQRLLWGPRVLPTSWLPYPLGLCHYRMVLMRSLHPSSSWWKRPWCL